MSADEPRGDVAKVVWDILRDTSDGLRAGQVAERAGITTASANHALARLERDGFAVAKRRRIYGFNAASTWRAVAR